MAPEVGGSSPPNRTNPFSKILSLLLLHRDFNLAGQARDEVLPLGLPYHAYWLWKLIYPSQRGLGFREFVAHVAEA